MTATAALYHFISLSLFIYKGQIVMSLLCFLILEWGGSEEVCSGLSGSNQAGGAEIPDAKTARRGKARQVRRCSNHHWLLEWLSISHFACVLKGQWGNCSGAFQSQLREHGADSQPEEGTDEEWVSGTSPAAQGIPMCRKRHDYNTATYFSPTFCSLFCNSATFCASS